MHSERPKLYRVLAVLSALGLIQWMLSDESLVVGVLLLPARPTDYTHDLVINSSCVSTTCGWLGERKK